MKTFSFHVLGGLPLVVVLLAGGQSARVEAASLINLGHAAGAQCIANGVNDAGVAVGACSPGNNTGMPVAWIATAGAETSLPPLAPGEACSAGGIANNGLVTGSCLDASSVPFAVRWNSASPGAPPTRLAPLPGLVGLGADVRTMPRAFNQSGIVAGQSAGSGGNSTAVIWPSGSGTPVQVSGTGDNCQAIDLVDTSGGAGNPAVLLNCPDGAGQTTPKIATATGLLGTYVMTSLPKAIGSTYCTAAAIDNASRIIGTCRYVSAPFGRAAFWPTPTATPLVLILPNFTGDTTGRRSSGRLINNAGHFVYVYQTPDGRPNVGYIDPTVNVPRPIPPIQAGTTVEAMAIGDNDLVVVAGENSLGNIQAAIFNPAVPAAVSPVPVTIGTVNSGLSTVSMGGNYAVGALEDASHQSNAVVTSLP